MKLLHPNDRLIFRVTMRFRIRPHDRDDAAQECRLGMLEQPHANPYWVCMQRCRNMVRSRCRFERRQRHGAKPEAYEPEPDARIDADVILSRLPERPARILRMWAYGWPAHEIARFERCHDSRIRQIVRESLERLRA